MSLVPMGASIGSGVGFPFGAAYNRYADVELTPARRAWSAKASRLRSSPTRTT
ncbi:MAG: hypothetical protein M5U19_00060 [Microthrixaceae bacterium]|nr:hypothetical protein [Microthrixaceae bacterium]